MNDKLDFIFNLQKNLNQEIIEKRKLPPQQDESWISKYALALYVEMGEMLNETNYKWWKNPTDIDRDAIKEELVDVLHFYVSMCLALGMDAQELFALYEEKNKENILRQEGKSKKPGYALSEQTQDEVK